MSTDPSKHGSESEDRTARDRRDALDETESLKERARGHRPNVSIEGYDIIRELHRGGQGVVYEAVQKSTKRKVAIKVLLEGQFASASARRRFEREVTLAAALKHPNIIAIFDSGEMEDGHKFCVMDYVRGTSIREHISQSKLSLEETLELFCSVCEAVHFAHLKGVIHRDLKPSNILVDTDGVPKVLDFGLAKQLAGGAESLVSMTGQVVGTLPYMSPEQTRGNPDEIDARSDVYALGVILYELLTGQHPYPVTGEMYEVIKHITETEPTPPSKVWTPKSGVARRKSGRLRVGQCPIDGELQTIAIKALAKERERRYQSADALRQDIASYLAGDPIEAKRDSSLYVLRKSLRRHRIPIAVMFGFVAVAAAALYVGSRTAGPAVPMPAATGPITSLAVLPLENLSGDPDQEYFADGMSGELITTLGKIKALKVISRMSVMEYKDTDKSPSEIARELNVDALVDGTVTRSGDQVRITVSLISAATSEQLWGDSYRREMRDVLTMQSEVARDIANRIRIQLTPHEQRRLASTPTVNPDAYTAYLRGLDYAGRPDLSKEEYRLAIQMFERAVSLDPDFALAYVQLSKGHSGMHHMGYDPTEVRSSKAKAAVDQALELQPELPEAHLALGYYHYWCNREYDWALEALTIAEKDLPNDARILEVVGYVRRRQGRFEVTLDNLKRAFELSPLSAMLANNIAQTYTFLRRYPDAKCWYDRSISLSPDQVFAYRKKAWNYWLWQGNTEGARVILEEMPRKADAESFWTCFQQELFERDYQAALDGLALIPGESIEYQQWFIPKSQLAGLVYRLMGEPMRAREAYDSARIVLEREIKNRPDDHRVRSSLGIVFAGLGRTEEAIREGKLGVELFPVSRDAMVGPWRVEDMAFIFVLVGEYDAALDQIEYLVSIPSWFSVPLLRLDPRWDPLRDHPRYQELLRRHGFEPEIKPQAITTSGDDKIMLAVLPFEDLSPDPQEWFSDGMTGELIATLGKIEALGVISRTSAMRYKHADKSLPQIARELNVSKIVEGSVLRIDGRVRITVNLIDAATDTHLWSNTYEHDERDVITLQNEVARAIAREIKIAVTPAEESRLATARQVNPEAYRLYLRGHNSSNEWTKDGFSQALEYFEQAIELDPTYGAAWAGRAEAYLMQGLFGRKSCQEVYPKAKAAAGMALKYDETLGLAHSTLGTVKFHVNWDWHGPEQDFQHALELSPGEAHIHFVYSNYLMFSGRFDEGIARIKRAVELDPFRYSYNAHLGWCYHYARRYDESLAQYQTLRDKDPNDGMARLFIPLNYAAKGMYDEALAECAKEGGCGEALGWVYAVAGRRQDALDVVNRLEMAKDRTPFVIAHIYAALGETDQAIAYIERLFEERDPFMLFLKVEPALDPLRGDPRFDDLLRRIGFEPTSIPVKQTP